MCVFQLIHRTLVRGGGERSQMKTGMEGRNKDCADGDGRHWEAGQTGGRVGSYREKQR